jgi:hypothetical protein
MFGNKAGTSYNDRGREVFPHNATSDQMIYAGDHMADNSLSRQARGSQHAFIANKFTAFLQKVDSKGFDPLECWAWGGAGKGNGYGNVTVDGKQMGAHRRSYELFCGEIPEGEEVCHTCDNRWCVNPDHLFTGTRLENMADCKSKGRTAGGNRKHLTESRVQEIRRRLNAGVSPRRISIQMDVSYGTVTAIKEGRSYVGIGV